LNRIVDESGLPYLITSSNSMLTQQDIERICQASHDDPFSVLGPHRMPDGRVSVRAFMPNAQQVLVIDADSGRVLATLAKRHDDGFFERVLTATLHSIYRLHVRWADGTEVVMDDPYRFPPVLSDMDVWLLGEGTHLRPYEVLGATPTQLENVSGTRFAVWAPNASRVSVIGDFNLWDGRRHPMRLRRECGVWELFLPGVIAGALYKFEIRARDGQVLPSRADPYARRSELRPATASVVAGMPPVVPTSPQRQQANALDAPMSIYEVHLGSWRRIANSSGDGPGRWLNWDELAKTLIPYARDMGFTHLELLPYQRASV
jgi:1,4-alpha-glucan branching enzyme